MNSTSNFIQETAISYKCDIEIVRKYFNLFWKSGIFYAKLVQYISSIRKIK